MITELIDNQKYKCFVTPSLCKDLNVIGLTMKTLYEWKIYNDEIILYTNAFDLDGYYKESVAVIDSTNRPLLILPAYTVMDLQSLFKDYHLISIDRKYKLTISRYLTEPVTIVHERLPDVFALMTKHFIKKGLLDLPAANEIIAYKQNG